MNRNILAIALLALTGCQLWHTMLEQPGDRAKRLGVDQQSTDTALSSRTRSAQLEKKTQVFTGKVVMIDGAYRLRLLKDESVLRLTRARRESEFAGSQINLRKYYEKVISVNGTLYGEWIFGADIVGQWTPPGGDTGPNMSAPKQTRP